MRIIDQGTQPDRLESIESALRNGASLTKAEGRRAILTYDKIKFYILEEDFQRMIDEGIIEQIQPSH